MQGPKGQYALQYELDAMGGAEASKLFSTGAMVGRRRCRTGRSTDGVAVGLDLLGVLFEGGGEAAVALGIGDEVEIAGAGGGDCGFQGRNSGVADGAGRQAGVTIGVVGRIRLEVGSVNGAAVAILEQSGIDDAGIGGERHVLGEAVFEDSGDEWALRTLANFFLDE